MPETNQFEPETEATRRVATHQLMGFKCNSQPMCSRSWQIGGFLQLSKIEWTVGERVQNRRRLVNHTNAA